MLWTNNTVEIRCPLCSHLHFGVLSALPRALHSGIAANIAPLFSFGVRWLAIILRPIQNDVPSWLWFTLYIPVIAGTANMSPSGAKFVPILQQTSSILFRKEIFSCLNSITILPSLSLKSYLSTTGYFDSCPDIWSKSFEIWNYRCSAQSRLKWIWCIDTYLWFRMPKVDRKSDTVAPSFSSIHFT